MNCDKKLSKIKKDSMWIIFNLNDMEYSINVNYVLYVEQIDEINLAANMKNHCPGTTQSRVDLIELLDLRALFGMGGYISTKSGKQDKSINIIFIETDGIKCGLIVEQLILVEQITNFELGLIREIEGTVVSKYISQTAK